MTQVYRFHDSVAVHLGKGETVYLRPIDARKLAIALNAAQLDCLSCKFTESTLGTVSFDTPDGRDGYE